MAGFQPVKLNGAHDVACLEALGAFEQIELHGLALVQSAITVLLNGGEMHEYVFAGGPLDEAKTLGSVEPLHCSLLSHKLLLSPLCGWNLLRRSSRSSAFNRWMESNRAGARCRQKQKCRSVHCPRDDRSGRTACDCLLFALTINRLLHQDFNLNRSLTCENDWTSYSASYNLGKRKSSGRLPVASCQLPEKAGPSPAAAGSG